jgi:hypothetical protein
MPTAGISNSFLFSFFCFLFFLAIHAPPSNLIF